MSPLTALYTLVLASFALASSSAQHKPQKQKIQWIDCQKNVPVPIQAALNITEWDSNTLGELPPMLTCGRLNVPLDYEKPFSSSNNITVAFSLYTPSKPVGTIFYNPGGPGEEAQSHAWTLSMNTSQLFAPLYDYQFMLMDTRGTHSSSALNCSVEKYAAIPTGPPKDEKAYNEYKKTSAAFAKDCLENSTPHGSIKHIGSQETIQDWESIRVALGKEKVSLIGVSYGTYWFSEYVQRYPHSIERAALDAVTIHGHPDIESIKGDVAALNRMLLRADGWCQTNSTCPFNSQGNGSVIDAWTQVLKKAEAGELSGNITVPDIRKTVAAYLRSTPYYDVLTQVLALALTQGDASGLAVPDGWNQAISTGIPLLCPDQKIDHNDFKGFQAIGKAMSSLDKYDLQTSFIWQALLDCSGWPVAGRPKVEIKSDFPYLWLTSDFDLNTPTEWANAHHDQTPKSTLIARHGDGHGSIFVLGPARDMLFEYIRTGKVSPSTNETLVTVYGPGVSRTSKDIPSPYAVGYGQEFGDWDALF